MRKRGGERGEKGGNGLLKRRKKAESAKGGKRQLCVEVIVIRLLREPSVTRSSLRSATLSVCRDFSFGELEGAESAGLLEVLSKHLVSANVVVRHGSASELHRLFEVGTVEGRCRQIVTHQNEI